MIILLNFAPTLYKFRSLQWIRNPGIFNTDCSTEIFKEKLLKNFGLIDVFVKEALEVTKRSTALVFTLIHLFLCFLSSRLSISV